MPQDKVTVIATVKAKPGMQAQVKEAVMALVGPTRAEAGCINYDFHQSSDDPGVFMLYENWVSKQALDEHLAKPYLEEFLGRADELLQEPVDIALWTMLSQPAA